MGVQSIQCHRDPGMHSRLKPLYVSYFASCMYFSNLFIGFSRSDIGYSLSDWLTRCPSRKKRRIVTVSLSATQGNRFSFFFSTRYQMVLHSSFLIRVHIILDSQRHKSEIPLSMYQVSRAQAKERNYSTIQTSWSMLK